ncbi:MAG: hypothetical protein KDE45_00525, partial [Caldilineaceae bacterium]|nr:hypothetical protein [Caldilineaceae bacterium]
GQDRGWAAELRSLRGGAGAGLTLPADRDKKTQGGWFHCQPPSLFLNSEHADEDRHDQERACQPDEQAVL